MSLIYMPQQAMALRPLRIIAEAFPEAPIAKFEGLFIQCVNALSSIAVYDGKYERPTTAPKMAAFSQTRMPEVRKDKLVAGITLGKREFAERAILRQSPYAESDSINEASLPPDLLAAVDHVLSQGDDVETDRRERLLRIKAIISMLTPLQDLLQSLKSSTALAVSASFNVAFSATCISAMRWPDVSLPLRMLSGFSVVSDIPDSLVYRSNEQPAKTEFASFIASNTDHIASMKAKLTAKANSEHDRTRIEACWIRTNEEIESNLIQGPFSQSQMDRMFGRGLWRPLPRSAILQKDKWRCIDDGKRSGHNDATTLHESITCCRADFPALVGREFARRIRSHNSNQPSQMPRFDLHHGSDDLFAAYRRVPTSQPEYTSVMVWDSDNEQIVYCIVPGHNFGLTSAVLNFNRIPHYMISAVRVFLGVCCEHYFDDVDTAEPSFCNGSGQETVVSFFSDDFSGFSFDVKKHCPMDISNEFLGVVSSYKFWPAGLMQMDITEKRRRNVDTLAKQIAFKQALPPGSASSLFGKARFAISPYFGSVGTACLQPIMARCYTPHAYKITDQIADSLDFISFLMRHLGPFTIPNLPPSGDKIVIFTDASGKKRTSSSAPTGYLGFVVFHPVYGTRHSHCPMPQSMVDLFDRIKQRKTYIGHFEMIAAIIPFLTLPPEWFSQYDVELWIDNTQAIGSFIKGYAGLYDCAKLVNLFKFAIARLNLRSIFIDYVPSDSNIADIPSRFLEPPKSEDPECWEIMGSFITSIIPALADHTGEWLSFNDIASSVWPEFADTDSMLH